MGEWGRYPIETALKPVPDGRMGVLMQFEFGFIITRNPDQVEALAKDLNDLAAELREFQETEVVQLVTIECSLPGAAYKLLEGGPEFDVHLAGPPDSSTGLGGVGRILCGFDRFQKGIGFSVRGGFSGGTYVHHPCAECKSLAGDNPIEGLHADLFREEGDEPANELRERGGPSESHDREGSAEAEPG